MRLDVNVNLTLPTSWNAWLTPIISRLRRLQNIPSPVLTFIHCAVLILCYWGSIITVEPVAPWAARAAVSVFSMTALMLLHQSALLHFCSSYFYFIMSNLLCLMAVRRHVQIDFGGVYEQESAWHMLLYLVHPRCVLSGWSMMICLEALYECGISQKRFAFRAAEYVMTLVVTYVTSFAVIEGMGVGADADPLCTALLTLLMLSVCAPECGSSKSNILETLAVRVQELTTMADAETVAAVTQMLHAVLAAHDKHALLRYVLWVWGTLLPLLFPWAFLPVSTVGAIASYYVVLLMIPYADSPLLHRRPSTSNHHRSIQFAFRSIKSPLFTEEWQVRKQNALHHVRELLTAFLGSVDFKTTNVFSADGYIDAQRLVHLVHQYYIDDLSPEHVIQKLILLQNAIAVAPSRRWISKRAMGSTSALWPSVSKGISYMDSLLRATRREGPISAGTHINVHLQPSWKHAGAIGTLFNIAARAIRQVPDTDVDGRVLKEWPIERLVEAAVWREGPLQEFRMPPAVLHWDWGGGAHPHDESHVRLVGRDPVLTDAGNAWLMARGGAASLLAAIITRPSFASRITVQHCYDIASDVSYLLVKRIYRNQINPDAISGFLSLLVACVNRIKTDAGTVKRFAAREFAEGTEDQPHVVGHGPPNANTRGIEPLRVLDGQLVLVEMCAAIGNCLHDPNIAHSQDEPRRIAFLQRFALECFPRLRGFKVLDRPLRVVAIPLVVAIVTQQRDYDSRLEVIMEQQTRGALTRGAKVSSAQEEMLLKNAGAVADCLTTLLLVSTWDEDQCVRAMKSNEPFIGLLFHRYMHGIHSLAAQHNANVMRGASNDDLNATMNMMREAATLTRNLRAELVDCPNGDNTVPAEDYCTMLVQYWAAQHSAGKALSNIVTKHTQFPSSVQLISVGQAVTKVRSESEEDSCVVCVKPFSEGTQGHDGTVAFLPQCRHMFHPDCLFLWLLNHRTCPLCRTPVEAVASSEPAPSS